MAEHDQGASVGIGRDSKVIPDFALGTDELNMRDFVGGAIKGVGTTTVNVQASEKPTSQGGSFGDLIDGDGVQISIALQAGKWTVMPDEMFHAPWIKLSGSGTVVVFLKG